MFKLTVFLLGAAAIAVVVLELDFSHERVRGVLQEGLAELTENVAVAQDGNRVVLPSSETQADGNEPEVIPEPVAIPLPEEASPLASAPSANDLVEPLVQEIKEAATPQASTNVPLADVPPTESEADQWQVFWKPFHSEVNATGFKQQLERVTGLRFRLEETESGVFQVAFAYRDEQNRRVNISLIESQAGLSLAELSR